MINPLFDSVKVGQEVEVTEGRICTTYPLNAFNTHTSQSRNVYIKKGIAIGFSGFKYCKSILVEFEGQVNVFRLY